MKKIYYTLAVLLIAMMGMAYTYFSSLNRENTAHDTALYAAAANSGLIFSLQQDAQLLGLLSDQDLLQQLTGPVKAEQLGLLKKELLRHPQLGNLLDSRNMYIGFSAGRAREIDFLISMQLKSGQDGPLFLEALRNSGLQDVPGAGNMHKFLLADSLTIYLSVVKQTVLLSGSPEPLLTAGEARPTAVSKAFCSFIQQHQRQGKNSLASVYIDFSRVPELLKPAVKGRLRGNLAYFAGQQAFSVLQYNFSKERLLFTGATQVNGRNTYLNLFSTPSARPNTIDRLLPENTANYRLYHIPDYKGWRKSLQQWFAGRREQQAAARVIQDTRKMYHLDTETIFPVYFQGQLIAFQLSTGEELAAVSLSNGEKVQQLLLDITEDPNGEIKKFRTAGLLYTYFGEPFRKFSRPYYVITDNYLVCAGHPAALRAFLNSYQQNKTLTATPEYSHLSNQVINQANITFYAGRKASLNLSAAILAPEFQAQLNGAAGLSKFSAVLFQLNAGQGSFQTSLLADTGADSPAADQAEK